MFLLFNPTAMCDSKSPGNRLSVSFFSPQPSRVVRTERGYPESAKFNKSGIVIVPTSRLSPIFPTARTDIQFELIDTEFVSTIQILLVYK